MIPEQTVASALNLEKKMYAALSEVAELTGELSGAVNRQDQVSVQLFLTMRQDLIDQLLAHRASLRRLYRELPTQDGTLLRRILVGNPGKAELAPAEQTLLKQVNSNRTLLERICRVDQAVSQRFGGPNSFYAAK